MGGLDQFLFLNISFLYTQFVSNFVNGFSFLFLFMIVFDLISLIHFLVKKTFSKNIGGHFIHFVFVYLSGKPFIQLYFIICLMFDIVYISVRYLSYSFIIFFCLCCLCILCVA